VRKRKNYLNLMNAVQIIVMVFLLSSLAQGQDYSLEYSQFGINGNFVKTPDYNIIDFISSFGILIETHESEDYSVEMITGFTGDPLIGVQWMLY